MAECESNYMRLIRLFPAMRRQDQRRIGFSIAGKGQLLLQVRDRSPYTTSLEIQHEEKTHGRWLGFPVMRVRIYHDARLAEVVACDGARDVRPRYAYPNGRMYQADEKAQWNRFLGEWLASCLANGYALEEEITE